jgi:hypothetical protein
VASFTPKFHQSQRPHTQLLKSSIPQLLNNNMYREYKQLNLPAIDAEILQFWEDEKIFER